MAHATTVGFENQEVAGYKGKSAKGEHLISVLSPENEEGKVLKQPNLPFKEDYIYTDKNIILGTDKYTKIPEAGEYSSTLIWTVEVVP